jgi:hypothetical protein
MVYGSRQTELPGPIKSLKPAPGIWARVCRASNFDIATTTLFGIKPEGMAYRRRIVDATVWTNSAGRGIALNGKGMTP